METIAISKFKATCFSLLDRVKRTGQPVLITKRGEPIAQVVPPPLPGAPEGSAFGSMAGSGRILGDIVEPLGEEFEELVESMQTPEAAAAVDALFEMTSEELGRAAVLAARERRD